MNRTTVSVGPEAMELLTRYPWPGNVRELQNILKWSLTMAAEATLTVEDLPDDIVTLARERPVQGGFFGLRELHISKFERAYLENILRIHGGDVTKAASEAKTPRGTFYRLLKKHGLSPEQFRAAGEPAEGGRAGSRDGGPWVNMRPSSAGRRPGEP